MCVCVCVCSLIDLGFVRPADPEPAEPGEAKHEPIQPEADREADRLYSIFDP